MKDDIDGTAIGRLKRTAGRRDKKAIDRYALRRLRMIRPWPPQRESDEDRFLNDLTQEPDD